MAQDLQNIPIDIHANRLLEWLISRRHSNKEWPDKISIVREKINTAIQDMPENATIGKILVGASPINYFHCKKIVEVLKETEADTKNIFGMYGSTRMKDWQDIIKCYQKDNLYLAECASLLARNVTYEIPAMKRLVTKAEQGQQECRKKEATCLKQAQDYREKFAQSCTQLGLSFENYDFKNLSGNQKPPSMSVIGNQLINLMQAELPNIFDKIAKHSKNVREGVLFYKRFLKGTVGLSDTQEKEILQMLFLVIEKGNVTTYEWKFGEAPLKIEPFSVNYKFEDDSTTTDVEDQGEIDFGELDFSVGGDDVQLETGDIDWGSIEVSEDNADSGAIDFNIELDTSGIILEDDGLEGGVAKNEDALTVLENEETRGYFIDEILELEGFLTQRIDEMKSTKANEVSLFAHEDSLSIETVEKLLKQTKQLLALFNENKTKQFLLVRESQRYITRLAESLLQNLKLAKKMDHFASSAQQKYIQLADEAEQIKPKIQNVTKQTREIQTELTKAIAQKYNNRPVYITGGV